LLKRHYAGFFSIDSQLIQWGISFDIAGSEANPVVCFAHSLTADSGMWAEQLPALIGAGFRVLRLAPVISSLSVQDHPQLIRTSQPSGSRQLCLK
jgi:hypothetical protein